MAISVNTQQTDEATALLSMAHAALGGDALARVSGFSVSGSLSQTGLPVGFSVEYKCVLPDRFLHIRRQTSPGGTLTYISGFNGDALIKDEILDTITPLPNMEPTAPDAIAAARTAQLAGAKKHFAFVTLPMFATSFSGAPLTFRSSGRVQVDGAEADAIDVTSVGGEVRQLLLATDTHLPMRLIWKARPLAVSQVFSTSTSVVTDSRGRVVAPPTTSSRQTVIAPNPAPKADVEWQTILSDYRKSDGIQWPHRLITLIAGQKYQDLRLGKFDINPKFSDSTFTPRK